MYYHLCRTREYGVGLEPQLRQKFIVSAGEQ